MTRAIRAARDDDLPLLQEIERAAGRLFVPPGMALVAEDDRPVAYLLADVVDGCAHLEQVTVHPDHAGRGLGRELIDHLVAWGTDRELPAVTVTTFTDVPWNGRQHCRPPDDTVANCRSRLSGATASPLRGTVRVA